MKTEMKHDVQDNLSVQYGMFYKSVPEMELP